MSLIVSLLSDAENERVHSSQSDIFLDLYDNITIESSRNFGPELWGKTDTTLRNQVYQILDTTVVVAKTTWWTTEGSKYAYNVSETTSVSPPLSEIELADIRVSEREFSSGKAKIYENAEGLIRDLRTARSKFQKRE